MAARYCAIMLSENASRIPMQMLSPNLIDDPLDSRPYCLLNKRHQLDGIVRAGCTAAGMGTKFVNINYHFSYLCF